MDTWVRFRWGRVRYRGRITRAPLVAWLETTEGQTTLAHAASQVRVPVFVRARAARRLWRRLAAAARDPEVVAIIQSEIDAYPSRVQEFAYAEGLPRVGVELHRLVVVPRVLINGAAYGAIARRLRSAHAFASLEGGDALRTFFLDTLVRHVDAAIAGARPSPKRPLALGSEWMTVGLDNAFAWRVPVLNEPPWDGHHYVLEVTRAPVTRAVRKAVVAAIARFDGSLSSLSRTERNEMLRRALHGA